MRRYAHHGFKLNRDYRQSGVVEGVSVDKEEICELIATTEKESSQEWWQC